MQSMKSKDHLSSSWQRNLWIMTLAQITTMIGFSSIFPFLPFYIQSIGKVSPIKMDLLVGLVYSSQAFTMMIASPFWGVLSDRYGRKLMVERAMFGGAVILTLMAFVRSAEELVILRAIQGLITGTVGAANALIAASVPKNKMGYAMGVLQVGMGAGIAIGPLIGGTMADMFGYRSAFYITGAMLFISGLFVLWGVTEHFEKPTESPEKRSSLLSEWRLAVSSRGVIVAFSLRFLNQLGRMIFLPILPLFVQSILAKESGINSFTGFVVGISSATMTTSSFFLGKLGDRIGYHRVVIGASLSCSLIMVLQIPVAYGWQILALHALFGIALGGIIPSVSALLSIYSSSGKEGVIYGLDNSIAAGARTLAPLIGVGISMYFGLKAVFAMGALLYFFAAMLAILTLRESER